MSPEDVRVAVTGELVAGLSAGAHALRVLPEPHVPVSGPQWQTIVDDLAVSASSDALHHALVVLGGHREAVGRDIGRQLIPAARTCGLLVEQLMDAVRELSIFAHRSETVGIGERTAVWLEDVAAWIGRQMAGTPPEVPSIGPLRSAAVGDPIEAAFDVVSGDLHDKRDAISDSRLLALYRERLGELADRCRALIESVRDAPVEPFGVLAPLIELLRAPRPLVGWRAARQGYALLSERADGDPEKTREALTDLRERAPARAASEQRLAQVQRQRAHASTDAERALALLSSYRILLEGQLRPLIWAMLRLDGAEGSMPMVNELRERCLAGDRELIRAAGRVILAEPRNADAHEQAHFDEISGQIVLEEGQSVDPDRIAVLAEHAQSMVAGLEVALACAVAELEPAARAYELRPGDPSTAAETLEHVEQRYGHAGLSVWSLTRNRNTVHVVLDELNPLGPNPCFVATMQGHALLGGVTRWQISLKDREGVVIDLSAQVLDANLPVYLRAANWFDRMPAGTFLPCNVWARLAVEPPAQAMRAAAWGALNDVQNAIDQGEETGDYDVALLDRRVRNTMAAVAATLRLLPPYDSEPLEHALRVMRQIRFSIAGLASAPSLSYAVSRAIPERNLFVTPSALPTLDPRPLDVVEAEMLGDQFHGPTPPHQMVKRRTGDPLGGMWRAPGATQRS